MNRLKLYTYLFSFFVLIYLALSLGLPPDDSILTRYDITPSQVKILSLTVVLPMIIIWFIALIGLRHVSHYATKIEHHNEGPGFFDISNGLAILVLGLPINSVVAITVSFISHNKTEFLPSSVIITNYLNLIIMFAGFFYIARGAKKFVKNFKSDEIVLPVRWRVLLIFATLGLFFVTMTNPARTTATAEVDRAVYYLPDWLIVTTILLPYVFIWYIGIRGSYHLKLYSQKVKGIIYKSALGQLSLGLAFVIGASIGLRFLTRLNAFFHEAELRILLGVIYLLLIVVSIGYIFIAKGATNLKKIEDV